LCRCIRDTLRNAKNGDINQAALLAEMLATGYGCNKDPDEARWGSAR
jgi:TPR repeat protein